MNQVEQNDLKKYYNFNLPMLKLMGVLAVLGVVVTVVLYHLF